jgi:2',3'-cyclic-nucleotide 2'-phosphodiesterase (5'-nucleotidase family)
LGGLSEKYYQISRITGSTTDPAILVDSGNLLYKNGNSATSNNSADIIAEAIAAAYGVMEFDAVAVGSADLAGGLKVLQKSAKNGLPWTSANLLDSEGAPLFPPYRTVQAGTYLIALIGMTDANTVTSKDYLIKDPPQSLAALLPGISKQADIIILLSSLSDPLNKSLAQRFPELDIIIGGDASRGNLTAAQTGGSIISQTAGRGQYLGVLKINWRNLSWGEPPSASLSQEKARLKSISRQINRLTASGSKTSPGYQKRMSQLQDAKTALIDKISALENQAEKAPASPEFNSYQNTFIALHNSGRTNPQINQIVSEAKKKINALKK